MRTLAGEIEKYLEELLRRSSCGWIEVQRKDLARRFSCVPSQITYVLNTRFTLRRGYLVESKRGGRGYIRIWRLDLPGDAGDLLGAPALRGAFTAREAFILSTVFRAVEEVLPGEAREPLRAALVRKILAGLEEFREEGGPRARGKE